MRNRERYRLLLISAAVVLLWGCAVPLVAADSAEENLESLLSLPYVKWSAKKANTTRKGVTKYERGAAFDGYNLYTNDADRALLLDMQGQVVHSWRFKGFPWCEYAHMMDNGDLLGVCVNNALVKVDWHSKYVWKWRAGVTHDVAVLEDGRLAVPFDDVVVPYKGRRVKYCSLAFLDSRGRFLGQWSTYKNFDKIKSHHRPTKLDTPAAKKSHQLYDYYHLNTIHELPHTGLGKRDARFRKGNFLICSRNVSLIAILDRDSMNIVWSWGPGDLDWPHHPTMLPNGNILIYDNGKHRDYTRIVELEPLTKKIVWEYKGDPPKSFYSEVRGSSQRLPNGNTLICESEKGRVFEITPKGRIVWEFWNPIFNDKKKRKRIYRFMRMPPEKVQPLLKKFGILKQ